jgi:hypothetical protein
MSSVFTGISVSRPDLLRGFCYVNGEWDAVEKVAAFLWQLSCRFGLAVYSSDRTTFFTNLLNICLL